jgi:hypothetical protein
MYTNHKLYVIVDIDKLSTDLKEVKKIIMVALERPILFEDERPIFDSQGKEVGYIGTELRNREETDAERNYRAESARCSVLRAENKGLREAVKEASIPADERLAAMQERIDKAEALARQTAEILRQ